MTLETTQNAPTTENLSSETEAHLAGDNPIGLTINDPEPESEIESDPLEEAVKNVEKKATKPPQKDSKKEVSNEEGEESDKTTKKYKIVVDKKEYEVDEETYQRFAQKGAAADKRLSELSKERKEFEARAQTLSQREEQINAFLARFQEDPLGVLEQLTGDRQKVFEKAKPYLQKQMEYENMDPKDRAILEERQKREAYEAKLAQREKEDEEREVEAKKSEYKKQFETVIIHAMDANGLPKTPKAVKAFAGYLQMAINKNTPITEELMTSIANSVIEDDTQGIREATQQYSEEAKRLEEAKDTEGLLKLGKLVSQIYGEPMLNLLRRVDLARIRAGQPQVPKKAIETPKTTQSSQPSKKYKSYDDVREEYRKNAILADAELKRTGVTK